MNVKILRANEDQRQQASARGEIKTVKKETEIKCSPIMNKKRIYRALISILDNFHFT